MVTDHAVIQQLLKECGLEQENVDWHSMTEAEGDVILAELHLMCKAALTSNISLRNRAKVASCFYSNVMNRRLHVFASKQATHDLTSNCSNVYLFTPKRKFARSII